MATFKRSEKEKKGYNKRLCSQLAQQMKKWIKKHLHIQTPRW